MSIILFGITLPDVVKPSQYQNSAVEAVTQYARGGVGHTWARALKEVPLDLVGGSNDAWIHRDTYISLFSLAESMPGWGTLQYESETYRVRFRHEDPPAVYAEPLRARVIHLDSDYYRNLNIKLMRENL